MKIIGHRGAAGLALENTLPSIELARLLGVDAIEFDVRKTKDDHLVLSHDADLSRISDSHARIRSLTLKELRTITLNDGQSQVPTLNEALRACGKVPVIIELKESECLDQLLDTLDRFPEANITVASFKHQEMAKLKQLRPGLKVYLAEKTRPIEIIQLARDVKADGVDLNFWLLNPLTYLMARRFNLEIMVFTVNSRILARFINLLYPSALICTNHPEWFIKHPWLKVRSSRTRSASAGSTAKVKKPVASKTL